jgi:glycosyltransferase involved in cell wall biosynthesis
MKNVLIIGNNWPEPSSTAAGTRMMQLIEMLQQEESFQINFCCATAVNERSVDLTVMNVVTHRIELNNSSFDQFIKVLQPELVIYDRFYIEEQYGWRVNEVCPQAKTILDTEDLHFLRKARQRCVKDQVAFNNAYFNHPDTYREIASIMRCDLSLIISDYEMDLLKDNFQIAADQLFYLPLLHDVSQTEFTSSIFEESQDFMSIGNFMHAPNEDAVWQLKKHIWPEIRKQLPKANLHIYGSYCQEKHFNWHNEKEGFLVHGMIEHATQAFQNKRVLLAPLRFGAGLKGKIFDAMQYGIPFTTTTIGAEGILNDYKHDGIGMNTSDFIDKSIQLYTNSELWQVSQQNSFQLLEDQFDYSTFAEAFIHKVRSLSNDFKTDTTSFHRDLLNYHSYQHLKFKSKWIEEKERHKKSDFN